MRFYTVSDNYINCLKKLDPRVPDNYKGKRPYIGFILEINGHKYLAPLTSYKPKQDQYPTSNPTIYKLHEKNNPVNKLGLIHLNNMIPVVNSEIFGVDFSTQPQHYKNLLTLQLAFIKANQDAIKAKALHLYNLVTQAGKFPLRSICCDFLALEAGYQNCPNGIKPTTV